MKRRKQPKIIQRKITITLGGRHVRTVKDKITLRQADAECGREHSPFCTTGDKCRITRRVKMLKIEIEWTAIGQPGEFTITHVDGMPDLAALDPSLVRGGPVL